MGRRGHRNGRWRFRARAELAEQCFLTGSLLDDGTSQQMDEAAQQYRRALDHDPDLVAAIINLANIRYAKDELAEAQALYERAIGLDPTYFEAYFNLGNITTITGATRTPSRATARPSTLIRVTPTRTSTWP